MPSNPAVELPRIGPDHARPRPVPDEVWRELLASAGARERLMARLAGEAGLRRAEVAQCHRRDLVRDHGGWALMVRGKGDRQRVVPITASLASDIVAHCECGFLFPGQINGHVSPRWVGTILSRLMPEGYSAHCLRHRFASRGYAGTGNLRAVQEALGHSSVATTQIYTAVTRADIRAVSEAAGDGNGAA
jgi:integrase